MSDVAVRTNNTTVGSSSETELSPKHSVLTVNRDVEQCGSSWFWVWRRKNNVLCLKVTVTAVTKVENTILNC